MQQKPVSKIRNKLRSRAGESISETLVSLLIAALALAMLAGAVTSGMSIVKKERSKLGTYYSDNEKIVKQDPEHPDGTTPMTIKLKVMENNVEKTKPIGSVNVDYYRNMAFGKTPVVAYRIAQSQN